MQTPPELLIQEHQCLPGKEQCMLPWLQPEEANTEQTLEWTAAFPTGCCTVRAARSHSFSSHLWLPDAARESPHPPAFRLGGKGWRVWGGINMQMGGDDSAAPSNQFQWFPPKAINSKFLMLEKSRKAQHWNPCFPPGQMQTFSFSSLCLAKFITYLWLLLVIK